ncbi:MAG TPA: hypothetical protein IAB55_06550 [Candidatus Merdivicinus faecavium]|nr:hypothetical protein [Candidatus Merdivicinus faecavium]
MKVARVSPRKTAATPDDPLAFFGPPLMLALPEIDEVHVSVTFTYDRPKAEALAYQWEMVGVPVKVGGPAYNDPAGEFTPGLYLKHGYTITSRGCNNHCWFCMASQREGCLRELEIKDGWDILDNNLLQCSEEHIRAVFEMLKRQPHRPKFTGGLEAKELKPWHCELLKESRPERMYFAYDTPDDYEPLVEAGRMLMEAGFTPQSHVMGCYNLIGYRGDTFDKAQKRLEQTIQAGFMPYAMLYRDEKGQVDREWAKFQREWLRPAIVSKKFGEVWHKCLPEGEEEAI